MSRPCRQMTDYFSDANRLDESDDLFDGLEMESATERVTFQEKLSGQERSLVKGFRDLTAKQRAVYLRLMHRLVHGDRPNDLMLELD